MQARQNFLGNWYSLRIFRQEALVWRPLECKLSWEPVRCRFPLHNTLDLCTILDLRICVEELQFFLSIFLCFMVTTDTSGPVMAEPGSKYCLVLKFDLLDFMNTNFQVCSAQIIDLFVFIQLKNCSDCHFLY